MSGKKQRGDDKVEITLDFDELKLRAGEAAGATKKALVSSVGNARQVGRSGTQPRVLCPCFCCFWLRNLKIEFGISRHACCEIDIFFSLLYFNGFHFISMQISKCSMPVSKLSSVGPMSLRRGGKVYLCNRDRYYRA